MLSKHNAMAAKPILLIHSAGTKLISLVFAYGFYHLEESIVVPATCDVSVPSLHTDASYRVLVSYHGVCCAINFCFL